MKARIITRTALVVCLLCLMTCALTGCTNRLVGQWDMWDDALEEQDATVLVQFTQEGTVQFVYMYPGYQLNVPGTYTAAGNGRVSITLNEVDKEFFGSKGGTATYRFKDGMLFLDFEGDEYGEACFLPY